MAEIGKKIVGFWERKKIFWNFLTFNTTAWVHIVASFVATGHENIILTREWREQPHLNSEIIQYIVVP